MKSLFAVRCLDFMLKFEIFCKVVNCFVRRMRSVCERWGLRRAVVLRTRPECGIRDGGAAALTGWWFIMFLMKTKCRCLVDIRVLFSIRERR